MNCKEAQEILLDHLEGTLDRKRQRLLIEHLHQCEKCRQVEAELSVLLKNIDAYTEKNPGESLEKGFNKILEKEKAKLQKSAFLLNAKRRKGLVQKLKVAATILLLIGSYYLGEYNANQQYRKEKALLQQEIIVSLMESNSASKRIQAVLYSKALDQTDEKILQAFINTMNNDKHVNVRLAAADALANYLENNMVRDALINRLKVEKNINMQLELIQILIEIQDDRILPVIKRIREDEETPSVIKEQIERQMSLTI